MSVIYTEPRYVGTVNGHGYECYEREVYCACGKKIGTQTKYDGCENFGFEQKEKKDYKFCPYCGKDLER